MPSIQTTQYDPDRVVENAERKVANWDWRYGDPNAGPKRSVDVWDGHARVRRRKDGTDGLGGTSRPASRSAHANRSDRSPRGNRSGSTGFFDSIADGIHKLLYNESSSSRRAHQTEGSDQPHRRSQSHTAHRRSETHERHAGGDYHGSGDARTPPQVGRLREIRTETWALPTSGTSRPTNGGAASSRRERSSRSGLDTGASRYDDRPDK